MVLRFPWCYVFLYVFRYVFRYVPVTKPRANREHAWICYSVTFFVIFIVMSSFSYLAIVMANEITGYTPKWLLKCFRPRQSALLSAANTIQNQKDDQIEMSVLNPTMVQE